MRYNLTAKVKHMFENLRSAVEELSPSCRKAARLQSEALDRPLTGRERFGLRLHLILCGFCRRYGRQLQFLREAAGQLNAHPISLPPQKLTLEARDRMKRQLNQVLGAAGEKEGAE